MNNNSENTVINIDNGGIMPLKYVSSTYEYCELFNFKTTDKTFLNIYKKHYVDEARVASGMVRFFYNYLNALLNEETLHIDKENKCFYVNIQFVNEYDNSTYGIEKYENTIEEGINIEYVDDNNCKFIIVEKDSPLIGTDFKGYNEYDVSMLNYVYDKKSLLNFLTTQTKDITFTATHISDIGYLPNVNYLNSNKVVGASGLFRVFELLREHLKENTSTIKGFASNEDIDAMFN